MRSPCSWTPQARDLHRSITKSIRMLHRTGGQSWDVVLGAFSNGRQRQWRCGHDDFERRESSKPSVSPGAVPEPSSIALILIGAAAMFGLRLRK